MKQLKDYKWLCNRYKVSDYILNNRNWEEISRRPLLEGFTTILVGTYILKEMRDALKILSKATSTKATTSPLKSNRTKVL